MANNWTSLQMTMTKNNSTQVVHYETDTANIVDFEQASNNLISAALNVFATNTTLKGTTTINKIKTNSSIDISTGFLHLLLSKSLGRIVKPHITGIAIVINMWREP